MPVTYTFANATTSIPLSQLDNNFATPITIGNVSTQLGNTVTNITGLTNLAGSASLTIGSNGNTTAMTIDTSQNVGIGTSSPNAKLHVAGNASNNPLYLSQNGGSSGYTGSIENFNTSGTTTYSGISIAARGSNPYSGYFSATRFNFSNGWWEFVDASGTPSTTINAGGIGRYDNASFQFYTNNAERMRIDSSGNVGIGTSNPSSPGGNLNFILQTSSSISIIKSFANSVGSGTQSRFDQSTGTSNSYTIMSLNDNNGSPTWQFSTGSGVGNVYWTNGSGGVYLAKNGTSWTSNSDEKLKNITGTIQNGLEKINTLRAAEFTWKDDEKNKPQVGLIAQDVQRVLPEVVKTNNDGHLGISYTEVIPLLVAAIQELKADFDAYKAAHP